MSLTTGSIYNDDITADYGSDQDFKLGYDSVSNKLTVYDGTDATLLEIDLSGNAYLAGRIYEQTAYGVSMDNLVYYSRCSESSDPLIDYSGNGIEGTFGGAGTPALGVGKYGNCLSFDGSTYVNIGNELQIYGESDITLSMWYKSTISNTSPWFGLTDAGDVHLRIQGRNTGACFFLYDGATIGQLDSTSVVNDGEWHHIVGVRDYTNGLSYLYVDGVVEVDEYDSSAIGNCTNTTDWGIGGRMDTGGSPSDECDIDCCMIWNRVLGPEEVYSLYKLNMEPSVTTGTKSYISGVTLNSGKLMPTVGTIHPVTTATADDTTPSVANCEILVIPGTWTTGNDITDFDDAVQGKLLIVIGGDADCVIDSSSAELVMKSDFTADTGSCIAFIYNGTKWYEVARNEPDSTITNYIRIYPRDFAQSTLYIGYLGAGSVTAPVITFIDTGTITASLVFTIPDNYPTDGSASIDLYSVCAAASPSGDAEWTISTAVLDTSLNATYENDTVLVTSYDTQHNIEKTSGTIYIDAAVGDLVSLQISRTATATNDTLGETAYLLYGNIHWEETV